MGNPPTITITITILILITIIIPRSSYPNGGLRATHRAGGYLAVDPTSPVFLRGDTVFVPACLVSYYGHALDEKTPLLRASDAMSREGYYIIVRLLLLLLLC